jgi:uncharacterized membrane protein YheB (UPF0754 family)
VIGVVAQAALTIVFGAIAGGVTNTLAIWMLFHPYEPPRLFGRRLRLFQGAIPKNKARLAGAIGRTVGTRLLTPEDLAGTLADPRFRAAFDDRLSRFLAGLLAQPRGSLSEILPPHLVAELRGLLEEMAQGILARLDTYLASDEFRATARRWAEAMAREVADKPLGDLLTPEREAALTTAIEEWIAETVQGPALERALGDYLDRTAERLLVPGRTFQELLPAGLVATVEKAIAGYLPLALERLGGLLEDQETRARVQRVLGEILERFMRDLRFHQRLVASLLITPETIDKVLRAVEAEGAGKISELLHEPATRTAMARGVNDAIVDLLRRPVDSVLGKPGDPNVIEARETITGWLLALARDRQTRTFLLEKLQTTLRAAERRTWGDLFRHLPPETIADTLVAALRHERAAAIYRDAAGQLVTRLLERPIGRIADHLPPDAATRIERAIADPLWGWLQGQVPEIAHKLDVAAQVERKILDFPMERVEELIRGVTERELHLIVRLGYVLGAVIGVISAALTLGLR